jgi:8-oxo-dGTP pyrophosphatase MutT (NUDIX family)
MRQKYEVFIANTRLILQEKKDLIPLAERSAERRDIYAFLANSFGSKTSSERHWKVDDPESEMALILKHFLHIEAAGGLVINELGEYLIIERLGRWDLPKGKIERGEGQEEAALREVSEECGLDRLQLLGPLPRTWHGYIQSGQHILKTTHWFEMRVAGHPELKAQEEEHITQAIWMEKTEFCRRMMDSYPAIQSLTAAYFEKGF